MGWVDSQTNDIFDDVGDGDDNPMLFSENILVPSALYQKFFSSELFMVPFATKHPTWGFITTVTGWLQEYQGGFCKQKLFLNMTRGA